jgi:hypothetical protein
MKGVVSQTKLCFPGGAYLPVVRYGHAGGGGGYVGTGAGPEDKYKSVCGRYYYFEPNSTTLMYLGRFAVFGSKIHAFTFLSAMILMGISKSKHGLNSINQALYGSYDPSDLQNSFGGLSLFPRKLVAGTIDMKNVGTYFNDFEPWTHFNARYKKIPPKTYWQWHTAVYNTPEDDTTFPELGGMSNIWETRDEDAPDYKGFPGQYDMLDQIICRFAQLSGLDTVIFQHEPEPDWTATEILSVREFEDYLCGPVTKVPLPLPPSASIGAGSKLKYARQWFKSYGFVYMTENNLYWSANKHSWWDPVFSGPGQNRGFAGGIVRLDGSDIAPTPEYDAIDTATSRPTLGKTLENIQTLRVVLPTERVAKGILSYVYDPKVFEQLWRFSEDMAMNKYH